jgi:DNA-directed RNA polymerase specialized sigma24 family protein
LDVAKDEENDLYAKWLETDPAERGDVEAKLCGAVNRHTQAVLWKKLGEAPPDLIEAIAAAVMTGLGQFRRECQFSTWVHEIAERKAKECIRGRVRARKVFDEKVAVVESVSDNDDEPRVGEIIPSASPQLEGEIAVKELFASLSGGDAPCLGTRRRDSRARRSRR